MWPALARGLASASGQATRKPPGVVSSRGLRDGAATAQRGSSSTWVLSLGLRLGSGSCGLGRVFLGLGGIRLGRGSGLAARLSGLDQPPHCRGVHGFGPTDDRGAHVVTEVGQQAAYRHGPNAFKPRVLDRLAILLLELGLLGQRHIRLLLELIRGAASARRSRTRRSAR